MNKIKSLIATVMVTLLGTSSYSLSAFAANPQTNTQLITSADNSDPSQESEMDNLKGEDWKKCRMMMHHMMEERGFAPGMPMMEKGHPMPWRLGLLGNKDLNENDAKIITKAALLMYGRKDLDIGKMTTKTAKGGRKYYEIQIVDKQNKIISTVALDSGTGFIRPIGNKKPE